MTFKELFKNFKFNKAKYFLVCFCSNTISRSKSAKFVMIIKDFFVADSALPPLVFPGVSKFSLLSDAILFFDTLISLLLLSPEKSKAEVF